MLPPSSTSILVVADHGAISWGSSTKTQKRLEFSEEYVVIQGRYVVSIYFVRCTFSLPFLREGWRLAASALFRTHHLRRIDRCLPCSHILSGAATTLDTGILQAVVHAVISVVWEPGRVRESDLHGGSPKRTMQDALNLQQ